MENIREQKIRETVLNSLVKDQSSVIVYDSHNNSRNLVCLFTHNKEDNNHRAIAFVELLAYVPFNCNYVSFLDVRGKIDPIKDDMYYSNKERFKFIECYTNGTKIQTDNSVSIFNNHVNYKELESMPILTHSKSFFEEIANPTMNYFYPELSNLVNLHLYDNCLIKVKIGLETIENTINHKDTISSTNSRIVAQINDKTILLYDTIEGVDNISKELYNILRSVLKYQAKRLSDFITKPPIKEKPVTFLRKIFDETSEDLENKTNNDNLIKQVNLSNKRKRKIKDLTDL